MKRFLTLLLAALLLGCLPALAEGADELVYVKEMGLSFSTYIQYNIVDKITNILILSEGSVVSHDPYCCVMPVSYCALTADELDRRADEIAATDDPAKQAEMARANLALFVNIAEIAVTQLPTPEKYMAFAGLKADEIVTITEFASVDGYHWYYITRPVDGVIARYDELQAFGKDGAASKAGREKARSEIGFCQVELLKYLETIAHVAPVDPQSALIGQVIAFESTDLDGNPVKSADLFRDNKITMVYLWGTWCVNCVNEMADLTRIHNSLRDKGFGIVGIEFEREPIEDVEKVARGIMVANGTNYPNVLMPEDVPLLNDTITYPTTFFVDSEGKILTYPIVGAAVSEYEKMIDGLLAGETMDVVTNSGATANGDNKYFVYVYDKAGNPVEGALVQFCDDVTCSFKTTNVRGAAAFRVGEQKVYEVRLLAVPEGYFINDKVYKTLENYSDVNIFIEKAE